MESKSETLTFNEFKRRAYREPSFDGTWIYKLVRTFVDVDLKVHYPMFDIDYQEERLFLTYGDAVRFLQEDKRDDTYCSWIIQTPIGERENEHGAVWLFDKDGVMIDYTTTYSFGDGPESHFYGRTANRQRFKKGDIVEVVSREHVKLAVLNSDVPDIEHCWKIYNRCKEDERLDYFLDYSDDTEVILDGPSFYYHEHVSPLDLMTPRFPIPEDIKKEMGTWVERAEKEDEERKEYFGKHRGARNRVPGENIGRFYEFSIHLHLDENSRPLLLIDDFYGTKASLYVNQAEYADYKDFNGRLTDAQLKALQDYLEDTEVGKTKWWYILRDWNEDEDHNPILLTTPLPDYTSLLVSDN